MAPTSGPLAPNLRCSMCPLYALEKLKSSFLKPLSRALKGRKWQLGGCWLGYIPAVLVGRGVVLCGSVDLGALRGFKNVEEIF